MEKVEVNLCKPQPKKKTIVRYLNVYKNGSIYNYESGGPDLPPGMTAWDGYLTTIELSITYEE